MSHRVCTDLLLGTRRIQGGMEDENEDGDDGGTARGRRFDERPATE